MLERQRESIMYPKEFKKPKIRRLDELSATEREAV
jgi:hypothetical protein